MQGQSKELTVWERAPFGVTLLITYAALLAASFAMLPDPFIRHDDFPALLADPDGYWIKTLDEGRWVNYLWHLREFVIPSQIAFALYQLLWAVFAAATALVICGREARAFYVATVSLMIVVAPPATLISLWFNTLIPGLAIVALFAVLVMRRGSRAMRPWLVLFVPLTLMCYTSYPLLLLVVLLVAHDNRWGWRDLAGLMALFVASFALGLLVIYSLNYAFHGVFGIPMADWREPNPPVDMAALMENVDKTGNFMLRMLDVMSWQFAPAAFFHLALFGFALITLARHGKGGAAGYIALGLAAGVGLVVLQILRTGILLSPRVMVFAWVFYVAALAHLMLLAHARHAFGARMLRNVAVLIAGSYLLQTGQMYLQFTPWQKETRHVAGMIADSNGPVWMTGSYKAVGGAQGASIQNARGLRMRLEYLTSRPVHDCAAKRWVEACTKALPAGSNDPAAVETVATGPATDGTHLSLPAAPEGSDTWIARN